MMMVNIDLYMSIIWITVVTGASSWKIYKGKKIPRYELQTKLWSPSNKIVQERLELLHNKIRSRVKPPASNMLAMVWDASAEAAAQNWAENCRRSLQAPVDYRWHSELGPCGQNIFISKKKLPWWYALQAWYKQKRKFHFGSRNNSANSTGHYLQMVWASSHRLGCGLAHCKAPRSSYFAYVCNYCPIGKNSLKLGRPYKKGRPCSACPDACLNNSRLCGNSCDAFDQWANCEAIYDSWPDWLCDADDEAGKRRRESCQATCTCTNSIH